MRIKDLGSTYRVYVSSDDVYAFTRTWPCSGLSWSRGCWFEFEKRNGDLVDIRHPGSSDGAALVALAEDAQRFGQTRVQHEHLNR